MVTLVKRSVFMSLFLLFYLFFLFSIFVLILNVKFIDSFKDGLIVFLLMPIVLALPGAVVAIFLGFISSRKNGSQPNACWLWLFASAPLLLLGFFVIWSILSKILRGSPILIVGGTLISAFMIILGWYGVARFLTPRILLKDGGPRWSLLIYPAVALTMLVFFSYWLSNRKIPWDGNRRTLIVGFDAADWYVVDRMTAEGDLPTFRKLQTEGSRFDLEPIEPLLTPIIWTSIASGVSPDKHGIAGPKCFFIPSSGVKAPRLWDIAEQNGATVGLLGWPATWPPRPIKYFMIPSLFSPGPETYPPQLQFIREIEMREKGKWRRDIYSYLGFGIRGIRYGIKLPTFCEAAKAIINRGDFQITSTRLRFLKLQMHGDIFLGLWERYKPTFACFYSNAIDACGHKFWKYFEPDNFPEVTQKDMDKYGGIIPEAYRRSDRVLQKILRYAPDNLNIVVVSDHGMQSVKKDETGEFILILTEKFLKALNLEGMLDASSLSNKLYLRPKGDLQKIPEETVRLIENIRVENTNNPVFKVRFDRYDNLIVSALPLPKIKGTPLLLPSGRRIQAQEILDDESYTEISGTHRPNALLLLKGMPIKPGYIGGRASVLDVAPTTLYMMDMPIDQNMEGRLLKEAFRTEYMSKKQLTYFSYILPSQQEKKPDKKGEESLKEILKSLGYIR